MIIAIQSATIHSLQINISLIRIFWLFFTITVTHNVSANNAVNIPNQQPIGNAYAFKHCRSLQAKPFDERSTKKKAIIIGDSQGCDFLNAIRENNYLKQYQIQFRFIPYACQRVPQANVVDYIVAKHRSFCLQTERVDTLKKTKQQLQQADLVIFAARWKNNVAEKLPQIFKYLGINAQQYVVVIGSKFFGNIALENYVGLSDKKLKALKVNVGRASLETNKILKQKLTSFGQGVIFIDSHQLICGSDTSCPVFSNELKLISYDGRHLTKEGARYFGKVLFQQSGLKILK